MTTHTIQVLEGARLACDPPADAAIASMRKAGHRPFLLARRQELDIGALDDRGELLRFTLERLRRLNTEVTCVAAEEHRFLVQESVEAADVSGKQLLEPVARNTAAAMSAIALLAFGVTWWLLPPAVLGGACALLVAGLVYNLPPLRFKDWPYLDALTESLTNPIRIAIGWHRCFRT